MKDIFVVVEQRNGNIQKVTLELIGEASKLAADLGEEVVAVLVNYSTLEACKVCLGDDTLESVCKYDRTRTLV